MTIIPHDQRADQMASMMARYLDVTIMEGIANDDVTEVYVNPQDGLVRFDTRSRGKVAINTSLDSTRIEMFLNSVATLVGMPFTPASPSIQAELPFAQFRGSRLQGFISPLTEGPCFVIRKPPSMVYSLDHYVQRGLLSTNHRAALREAVEQKLNVLVIGGTNSGKTTFANALLHEITTMCPFDRIVILEDTVELQCIANDHLSLRSAPNIPLAHIVKMTLRTTPNRIVVGEVRDEAALDLLDAWATGHPGGVATLHATSPEGALLRLDRLAQRARVPSQLPLIVEAIHMIALMQNDTEGRRMTTLAQVIGLDTHGQIQVKHLPA